MLRYFFCLLALLVLLSCSGRKSAPATAPEKVPPRLFRVEAPPGPMDDAQRYAYLREHFWDDLDFADTVFIVSTDTIHMLRAFDTYIRNFVTESDPSPVAELMRKASGSKIMLEYFAMLAERVLHDPNSPLHSDELYIPVLEALAGESMARRVGEDRSGARPAYGAAKQGGAACQRLPLYARFGPYGDALRDSGQLYARVFQ